MKRVLGVSASDTVNLYGSRFTVGALASALWDNCQLGNPWLMSHDFTRPVGWKLPVAIHMEPGLSRLVGLSLIPETDAEWERLILRLNAYLQKRLADECEPQVEELREKISDYLRGGGRPFCRGCVALVEQDLAARTFSNLFARGDKHGLVPLSALTPIGPGVFRVGELAVFAHPFFRRSLSRLNTLNAPFLKRIQDLSDSGSPIRIALDRDMVGLASTYTQSVELEYWRGPKFDDDLASIPPGVTHHEADEAELMFHSVSRTEFRWQSRDAQHIFEAEELRDTPSTLDASAEYGCRYVHSIVEEDTKSVIHIDGAVRMYSEEEMIDRLEVDIAHAGKNTEYTKLWRLDEEIDVPTWKSLLSDYFRDNRLVGEYLGAPGAKDGVPRSIRSTEPRTTRDKYIPYSMERGAGVRVSLSFGSRPRDAAERTVTTPELLSVEDRVVRVVDAETIELRKALERLGTSLLIPDDVRFMKYEDGYVNLPTILHSGTDVEENLRDTLAAIGMLVRAWNARGLDKVVGWSVAFPVAGKEARVSVLGHVVDLQEWFSSPLCRPPTTPDKMSAWADQVSHFLSRGHAKAGDEPRLFDTLKETGVLWIDRSPLKEEQYSLEYLYEDRTLKYELKIPEDEEELIRGLRAKEISPALAFSVSESRCSACESAYVGCACSKLLDEEVSQVITGMDAPFLFWTDRPI